MLDFIHREIQWEKQQQQKKKTVIRNDTLSLVLTAEIKRPLCYLQSLKDGFPVHGLFVVGGLVEGRGERAQRHQLLHTNLQNTGI